MADLAAALQFLTTVAIFDSMACFRVRMVQIHCQKLVSCTGVTPKNGVRPVRSLLTYLNQLNKKVCQSSRVDSILRGVADAKDQRTGILSKKIMLTAPYRGEAGVDISELSYSRYQFSSGMLFFYCQNYSQKGEIAS